MIRPTKHNHPDQTVVYLSFIFLEVLRKRRIIHYEKLREIGKKKVKGADFLLRDALNVLFLLGLVEYRLKTDSIEYTGK